jgi:hypothetical protein
LLDIKQQQFPIAAITMADPPVWGLRGYLASCLADLVFGRPSTARYRESGRHIHVTISFRAKVPAKTTSRSVGHNKTAITIDRYTHLASDEMEHKATAVNNLLRTERAKVAAKMAG